MSVVPMVAPRPTPRGRPGRNVHVRPVASSSLVISAASSRNARLECRAILRTGTAIFTALRGALAVATLRAHHAGLFERGYGRRTDTHKGEKRGRQQQLFQHGGTVSRRHCQRQQISLQMPNPTNLPGLRSRGEASPGGSPRRRSSPRTSARRTDRATRPANKVPHACRHFARPFKVRAHHRFSIRRCTSRNCSSPSRPRVQTHLSRQSPAPSRAPLRIPAPRGPGEREAGRGPEKRLLHPALQQRIGTFEVRERTCQSSQTMTHFERELRQRHRLNSIARAS